MARVYTVRITGSKRVAAELAKNSAVIEAALRSGVYLEGNNIMAISKRRVPVDLGALKGSGYVTLPRRRGNLIISELGYGGPAAAYAEVQHEHTEFNHPEGGEAKFLERPVDERAAQIPANIAALAQAAIKRGIAPITTPLGEPQTPWEGPGGAETLQAVQAIGRALRSVGRSLKKRGGGTA